MRHFFNQLGLTTLFILIGLTILTWNAYADDSRVHVAIIDTGVDLPLVKPYMCSEGHLDLTGKGLQDVNGHGTNIAGIFARTLNTKTHCLQIIKWYHDGTTLFKNKSPNWVFKAALLQALRYQAKYVNMSLAGTGYNDEEKVTIQHLLYSGAVVAVAAGNEGLNLDEFCKTYPACYSIYNRNFVVVGNRGNSSSNTGKFLVMEDGNNIEGFGITASGTSQATAVYLSKRIK